MNPIAVVMRCEQELGRADEADRPRLLLALGRLEAGLEVALCGPCGKGGRVHILRHTFCSRLALRNVPMLTIKELPGHVSLETTQRVHARRSRRAAGGHPGA